ncbi:hypothetical protein [Mycolicibacterium brisbanense]|nr:hypothetical protein [Mycolicibacterium brisbanense]MCV7161535.1 hypothetical protein [Mycolicibacterium brisbanense]
MSTAPLQSRTRLSARSLGPCLVVAAVTSFSRGPRLRSMVEAIAADPVSPSVAGAFVLPMGLVVIAPHPFSRGPAAIVVSLLGWLTTFKGLAPLAFPHTYLSVTYVGGALTRSHSGSHQSVHPTPDLPRAA